ncbi:Transcriptional regulator, TetR family [Alloactinosynnema sp. L-07]|uniref:TetR-like C-terminal domain-containing protein n=1 Tax=Alloactinosynnema sp. L-07 TaxID=1653480 RepID=UPI00065EF9ED|nr:TetR-like C-terminal domain-containing protein [Alloactinosynnema sp. L-07]CRK55645.1 Transcriptional regulator, TetR family [Alloactinosynnema sp. L-07]
MAESPGGYAAAGRAARRAAIVDAATRLLVHEGTAALTTRRVASEVGASTKVIYTMFGGKAGLVKALYVEGFTRLRQVQDKVVDSGDPVDYLTGLALAYRRYALREPHYYRVMFERAIPGFVPDGEALAVAERAAELPLRAIAACVERGVFAEGEPREIAELLLAASHGAVSMELAGHFRAGTGAKRYGRLIDAVIVGFSADRR